MAIEEKVGGSCLFEGKVLKLEVDQVRLQNGRVTTRELVRHRGAVAVAALTDQEELLIVRQYRYAIGQDTIEVPAGKLEAGEDPVQAALRELEEETGAVAGHIEPLGYLYTSPAILEEKIYLYFATDLTFVSQHPDDGEYVEAEAIPIETLVDWVLSGKIIDAKTQSLVLWIYARLKRK